MNKGRIVSAGMIGALVITALTWVARNMMGMPVNMEMMLGTMFGSQPSQGIWLLGFGIHLMMGIVFAFIYAWAFERLSHHAGAGTGTGYGLVHGLVSGLMLGVIPAIHPLIPEQLPAPGIFMYHLGMMGIVAFIMLHLIFGAIAGGMYGQVHTETPTDVHGMPHRSN